MKRNDLERALSALGRIPVERIEKICDAERDGRLVVLPCKVGDTVYAYEEVFNRIAPFQVDMVQLYGHDSMSFCANWRKNGELMADLDFDKDEIGITVFLTREEAIAAWNRRADAVSVVRGEWGQCSAFDEDENVYTCSVCGEPWTLFDGTPQKNNMNFCPNCGAKMESEGST